MPYRLTVYILTTDSNLSFRDDVEQVAPCELTNDVCAIFIVNLRSTVQYRTQYTNQYLTETRHALCLKLLV